MDRGGIENDGSIQEIVPGVSVCLFPLLGSDAGGREDDEELNPLLLLLMVGFGVVGKSQRDGSQEMRTRCRN